MAATGRPTTRRGGEGEAVAACGARAAAAAAASASASAGASRGDGGDGADGSGDDGGEDATRADGEVPTYRWLPTGWVSHAARFLQATLSTEKMRQHQRARAKAIPASGRGPSARVGALDSAKIEMLDMCAAMPVPPPEDPTARSSGEASRRYWARQVCGAASASELSEALTAYARLLPKAAFKKGFRRWWLADGGSDEGKAKVAGDKELRSKGGAEARSERDKEAKELPPPQADSAHQVLLRLQLLDCGLAYASVRAAKGQGVHEI